MKQCLCLWAIFFAFIAEVQSEPTFNALSPDSPGYAAYQQELCEATADNHRRFARERWEMDRWSDRGYPMLPVRSEEDRQAYIENWVLTTELRDQAQRTFDAHCR
jgi:hypothetical protein